MDKLQAGVRSIADRASDVGRNLMARTRQMTFKVPQSHLENINMDRVRNIAGRATDAGRNLLARTRNLSFKVPQSHFENMPNINFLVIFPILLSMLIIYMAITW